jgi:hypothetical protein
VATKDQLAKIIATAKGNEHWKVAMYCAAVAAGTWVASSGFGRQSMIESESSLVSESLVLPFGN